MLRHPARYLAVCVLTAVVMTGMPLATQPVAARASSPPALRDIKGHWAEADIRAMVARGVVGGYPDGTFRPEDRVKRSEFIKMLVECMGLRPVSPEMPSFAALSGHWAAGYIEAAAAELVLNPGDYVPGDGFAVATEFPYRDDPGFDPERPITRFEMAVLVSRGLRMSTAALLLRGGSSFTDAGALQWRDRWGHVNVVARAGILEGYPDRTFKPWNTATRAEAVTILARFLRYTERLATEERPTFVVEVGSPDDRPSALIGLPDGGLAVVGGRGSPHSEVGPPWLACLDGSGRVLWEKTFADDPFGEFRDVVALPDGSLLLAGWTGRSATDPVGLAVRVDGEGRVLWTKVYGPTGRDFIASAHATPDGRLAVACSPWSVHSQGSILYVLSLDGTVLSSYTLPEGVQVLNTDRTQSGGFLVCGVTSTQARSLKNSPRPPPHRGRQRW